MKKLLSLSLVLLIALLFALPTFAASDTAPQLVAVSQLKDGSFKEVYSDGCYAITTISETTQANSNTIMAAAQTKSGTKGTNFYNANNVLLWTVSITGTFSYDGSSATCTGVTKATSIKDGNWKVTAESCSKSGNKALGSFTVKRYALLVVAQTENVSITLTCSASGVLS